MPGSGSAFEVALLGYDRAIRHIKWCVRGPQGLGIDGGEIAEIFLPSEIVGSWTPGHRRGAVSHAMQCWHSC
jgi:hypothetical protein